MDCLMDHIVLNIENEEKMITFYLEVLALAPDRLGKYRIGKVPFPSVRLNSDTVIDLFPKKLWQKVDGTDQNRVNLNHFCISLSKKNWDSLIERINLNNINIEEGPVSRWGAHGTGTSIYFRDPDGNLIEAKYYEGQDNSGKCLLDS
jgi:extradiol dioxygenase family protein